MKKSLVFITLGLLFITSIECKAQLELIHYWHFNSTLPIDGSGGIFYGTNPIYADYSTTTEPSYLMYTPIDAGSSNVGTVDNCTGKSKNDRYGYGGCCGDVDNGLRLRNPSDNMEFVWFVPTTNYQDIILTYATESSSFKSGQQEQDFSYSLDNGKTYITTDLPVPSYIPDTSWKKVVLDLHTITSLNNNNQLVFRLTFIGQTTGTKGNNRFDNITVEGNVLGTDVKVIDNQTYSLFPNPAEDYVRITAPTETTKTIEVYSLPGNLVSKQLFTGKQISLKTSDLCPGLYYLNISSKDGSVIEKMKFVKK
jgi:hypothetical protein